MGWFKRETLGGYEQEGDEEKLRREGSMSPVVDLIREENAIVDSLSFQLSTQQNRLTVVNTLEPPNSSRY